MSIKRITDPVEGSDKWLVVCVECKGAALEVRMKMEKGRVDGLELSVKSRVVLLCGRQLGREEGEWPPVLVEGLLEKSADVCVGGFGGED